MRIAALFMCLLSVGSWGCVMSGRWLFVDIIEIEKQERKKHDPIQIVAFSTKPNGATTKFEYTFRKSGKSLVHLSESESRIQGPETLEFPACIHEECLARLQDSEFFKLESNEPRWTPFAKAQKPVSSIEVRFRDQKHVVKEYANLDAQEGYTKFKRFLDDVRRHRAVRASIDGFTTGFLNRTSDQLGGVITGLTPAEPQTNRIEIVAIHNVNITRNDYHWTLEKDADSRGHIVNSDFCTTHASLKLPTTAYDEFLAMIEKTQFFQMKSATAPSVPSGIPLRSIEVNYAGQKHVVTQKGDVDIDPGFEKMWVLIGDLARRSTRVVPATPKRNLDRLGGLISGLTPAGILTPETNIPVRNNRD